MNRIRAARESAGVLQKDVAEALNVKQNTISNWENGRSEPDMASLAKMAVLYHTSVDYLIGRAVQNSGDNVVKIPVLGSVPAGIPIEAIEDIIDWEELPQSMATGGREYFALQVQGDSMWPDYLPGDVVIVRKQATCDCGEVAVVYVNGYEATLKQVKFNPDEQSMTLQPKNPNYPPRTFSAAEIAELPVKIAGVVVELRRKIKK